MPECRRARRRSAPALACCAAPVAPTPCMRHAPPALLPCPAGGRPRRHLLRPPVDPRHGAARQLPAAARGAAALRLAGWWGLRPCRGGVEQAGCRSSWACCRCRPATPSQQQRPLSQPPTLHHASPTIPARCRACPGSAWLLWMPPTSCAWRASARRRWRLRRSSARCEPAAPGQGLAGPRAGRGYAGPSLLPALHAARQLIWRVSGLPGCDAPAVLRHVNRTLRPCPAGGGGARGGRRQEGLLHARPGRHAAGAVQGAARGGGGAAAVSSLSGRHEWLPFGVAHACGIERSAAAWGRGRCALSARPPASHCPQLRDGARCRRPDRGRLQPGLCRLQPAPRRVGSPGGAAQAGGLLGSGRARGEPAGGSGMGAGAAACPRCSRAAAARLRPQPRLPIPLDAAAYVALRCLRLLDI